MKESTAINSALLSLESTLYNLAVNSVVFVTPPGISASVSRGQDGSVPVDEGLADRPVFTSFPS